MKKFYYCSLFLAFCKQRHIHAACSLIVKPLQPRASLFRYYSNIWICVPTNILRAETNQPFGSLSNSINVYGESDKSLKLTLFWLKIPVL